VAAHERRRSLRERGQAPNRQSGPVGCLGEHLGPWVPRLRPVVAPVRACAGCYGVGGGGGALARTDSRSRSGIATR
jgi:hypothetical protein